MSGQDDVTVLLYFGFLSLKSVRSMILLCFCLVSAFFVGIGILLSSFRYRFVFVFFFSFVFSLFSWIVGCLHDVWSARCGAIGDGWILRKQRRALRVYDTCARHTGHCCFAVQNERIRAKQLAVSFAIWSLFYIYIRKVLFVFRHCFCSAFCSAVFVWVVVSFCFFLSLVFRFVFTCFFLVCCLFCLTSMNGQQNGSVWRKRGLIRRHVMYNNELTGNNSGARRACTVWRR